MLLMFYDDGRGKNILGSRAALALQLLVRPEADDKAVTDSTPADSPSNDVSSG